MTEFTIEENLKNEIEQRIKEVIENDVRLKIETQDAGCSLFVMVVVMPSTTVSQIFRMSDDIDKILSSYLPLRREEPRWAQSFSLNSRIIYGNIGGLEF